MVLGMVGIKSEMWFGNGNGVVGNPTPYLSGQTPVLMQTPYSSFAAYSWNADHILGLLVSYQVLMRTCAIARTI